MFLYGIASELFQEKIKYFFIHYKIVMFFLH